MTSLHHDLDDMFCVWILSFFTQGIWPKSSERDTFDHSPWNMQ